MRLRLIGSRLPAPAGDIVLFAVTVAGFLALWRLSGSPVDCGALLAAIGCAVALGWWDNYRRAKRWEETAGARRSASA
jgi:UDP-N-acetylmuramyl pentapeptide phosphotransferase/UDP-N-acetylglucosamine-1-phosphate transferase